MPVVPAQVRFASVRRLTLISAAAVLFLAASAAVAAPPPGVWIIVPGQGIGPVKIGMTPPQVHNLSGQLPCDIAVAYAEGRASRMETNCVDPRCP